MKKATIYANPTVKEVVFQVRFPQLFFLESKIGEFQLEVMEKFPKSELIIQQQVTIGLAPVQPSVHASPNASLPPPPVSSKSWSFESENGIRVVLSCDALSVTSKKHKSFSSAPQKDDNFRNIVTFVVDAFLKVVGALPIFTRIGLRYIDTCEKIEKTSATFKTLFNSRLPIKSFPIEECTEMFFTGIIDRKESMLIYKERVITKSSHVDFVFDFDAYKQNIEAKTYETVLDQLYEVIAREYDSVITKEMKKKMNPIKRRKQ